MKLSGGGEINSAGFGLLSVVIGFWFFPHTAHTHTHTHLLHRLAQSLANDDVYQTGPLASSGAHNWPAAWRGWQDCCKESVQEE